MMSALWKIKRKPRIENNDKSGDSVYRSLHLVSTLESYLASLVQVATWLLNSFPDPEDSDYDCPISPYPILYPRELGVGEKYIF